MTRKTSAYAAKMRRQAHQGGFNGAEWLNAIQRCRPYTDDAIPGSFHADGGQTASAARGASLRVRAAYDAIKTGDVKGDDVEPHDLLAHALGVAWLRAIDIAGVDHTANPMLPIISQGTQAVQRMAERKRRFNIWQLDKPGIAEVAHALDVYDEILINSSPAQMAAAAQKRAQLLDMHRKLPDAKQAKKT
jgi:hypothetical protein